MAKELFLIILTYKKDVSEIDDLMPVHVTYLKKYYKLNKFIVSGRQVPRKGGIILCYADDLTEVNGIVAEDPFIENGAATYKIIRFRASMSSSNFKALLDKI